MKYIRLGACIYIESENTFASMPYALLQIMLCYLKFLEAWSRRDKFKVCTIIG